ncbi:YcxB family protein [Actinoplanes sp. TBRC 11911]|uniref:PH domain-containing protein n=1 Tax=Actinoplanes sp. TBRC 11911 TaxID=2729386 RepID=UPI00145EE111|nr:PH domain-containing protein [Actinoplanes sp. TBRC 11911]NMO56421.1 YcxB family protein [Actinoplanes sp. TBRC 11911]
MTRAYRVDRTGITITAGFSTVTTPWSAVTGVQRRRGQMIVHQGWRKMLGIPTGALTEQDQTRLWRLLQSRGAAQTVD